MNDDISHLPETRVINLSPVSRSVHPVQDWICRELSHFVREYYPLSREQKLPLTNVSEIWQNLWNYQQKTGQILTDEIDLALPPFSRVLPHLARMMCADILVGDNNQEYLVGISLDDEVTI